MIHAEHISKTYGNTEVLNDISFSLGPSEIVSIVGPSGAGKTTLLHILGTLDRPDPNPKTELLINNQNINALSDKALSAFRNESLGFVFQFHQLLPEFTAIENICLPAYIKGTSKKDAELRAMELLDFFGLTKRAQHKPSELSGGEQQRVAVARALINKPRLLLADEPSGNLDSTTADTLHDMFFNLRDTFAISMVLVTHNKSLAARADRMLTLVDGRWS
jgi:lipoprotein-releasing system ATP-binding protein